MQKIYRDWGLFLLKIYTKNELNVLELKKYKIPDIVQKKRTTILNYRLNFIWKNGSLKIFKYNRETYLGL